MLVCELQYMILECSLKNSVFKPFAELCLAFEKQKSYSNPILCFSLIFALERASVLLGCRITVYIQLTDVCFLVLRCLKEEVRFHLAKCSNMKPEIRPLALEKGVVRKTRES